MDTVIVYESMWGNTAAIAESIAGGYGDGAVAMTTDEATPAVIEKARLVIAGAPVHALNLPTDATRASAQAKDSPGHVPADLTHPSLRAWLEALPAGPRWYAAFETRIVGPLGHGSADAIARAFSAARYEALDRPHSFTVTMRQHTQAPAAMLLPGQEQHAFEWGIHLRHLVTHTPELE
ncbi:hypothetical protein [Demequina sp. NBRC 110055]|uniref:flavodoxin family protein n=1 Tax=Demequina sp. NBRC 110055 TaxID=1570344 RepID=UPI000A03C541|nr:hypothetical protein [Demequina sp. NBRC 110055]